MAYKTRGYQYLHDRKLFKEITQKFLLKLPPHERRLFIDQNKPFYFDESLSSPKMTFNMRQQTFRFYPSDYQRIYCSEEESYTHKLCKDVICGLNEISLKFDVFGSMDTHRLKYNYSFDELPIRLKDGVYIVPDVIIYFKQPYELAYKWNRILALEIKVSHKVPPKKLELYKQLKIPVLQINANKKWGKAKEYEMSKEGLGYKIGHCAKKSIK